MRPAASHTPETNQNTGARRLAPPAPPASCYDYCTQHHWAQVLNVGFYVELTSNNAVLPAANHDAAYAALCALNDRNDLKRGGKSPASQGAPESGAHPDQWFSWMAWDYPNECSTVQDILEALGFETDLANGELVIYGYSAKTGNEDEFLKALAPYLQGPDGCPVEFRWRGEDDSVWRQVMRDGELVTEFGRIVYDRED